jgi:hypothetical protein
MKVILAAAKREIRKIVDESFLSTSCSIELSSPFFLGLTESVSVSNASLMLFKYTFPKVVTQIQIIKSSDIWEEVMLIIIPFVSVNSFAYSHPNEIYPGSQIQKCGNRDDFRINFIFSMICLDMLI